MTFPIVLLIAGLVLVLIGLLGKIQMKEVVAGTDSGFVRAIVSLLGLVLLVVSFVLYRSEKTQNPVPEVERSASAVHTPTATVSPAMQPSPTGGELGVSITAPAPNDRVEVTLDNGAALIPVTGWAKGLPLSGSSKTHVYVFTNTGQEDEWWYNEEADPDQDNIFKTVALAGSSQHPAKNEQQVTIRAVVATEADIQTATKGTKVVKRLNLIDHSQISNPISIVLKPRS